MRLYIIATWRIEILQKQQIPRAGKPDRAKLFVKTLQLL
jgi:hypothetical protein